MNDEKLEKDASNKQSSLPPEETKNSATELNIVNKELIFQKEEKRKRAAELVIANIELAFQTLEKKKRAAELLIADKELAFQVEEKQERAAELLIANRELAFQKKEKKNRAAELTVANKELAYQKKEKKSRAAELLVANLELVFQNEEKEKRAAELIVANNELAYQNKEKESRAAELIIANKELVYQNEEKEKRAAELIVANRELVFQNEEKEKRAAELSIANNELAYQNKEKESRAAELIIANRELLYQNGEKEKRAAELIIANDELVFQNVEKEKRAAELSIANIELQKAEQQFRLVVEAAPNALILADDKGRITLVNYQTEMLFGYHRSELMAESLESLLPEQFGDQYLNHPNPFLQSGITDSIRDFFAKKKDGTSIQVEVGWNPIETGVGHMILVSIVDVTARKMQEATLKKQHKELEQFAYIASHDLQEPLRTVCNYMQVFEEDYLALLDANAHKYLQSVNNATKRMSMLIRSLLDFSRLSLPKELTFVNCKELIDEVLDDLDKLVTQSCAIIEVTEMPELYVYETELRQMFQNLITNAIKFKKRGVKPEIKIAVKKVGQQWIFSVRDNGIGIAKNHYDRVFDVFQRLHSSEEYEGNGIGLANCKKIAQLHHGEIWLESILGEGTTFYFTIPMLQ
ncbi:MAG: ATP-binding protein [Chryseolinea sp.]